MSSLCIQDHLDIAIIKLDELHLSEHWKYVTIVLLKCAGNHIFDHFKGNCIIITKSKTFKTVLNPTTEINF